MERKIVVYGHPDKRPDLGFPTEREFEQWIKEDIFTKNNRRYRYTIDKNADVIVLSRYGLAYGHFEIEDKVGPDEMDYQAYPEVKVVYIVRTSLLYSKPVRLADFAITGIQFGKNITEAQFDEIKKAAGAG